MISNRQSFSFLLKKFSAILVGVILIAPLHAAEGILIKEIPANVDNQAIVEIIEKALTGREWKVTGVQPASVSARLKHLNYTSMIVISVDQDAILYTENTKFASKRPGGGGKGSTNITADAPERWINFLKKDINEMLIQRSTVSAAASGESVTAKPNAVDRLKELEELKRLGLVSDIEYERKRAEILADL